jgi:rod shape-determining protein MreC
MLVFSRYTWWMGAMLGLALLLTVFSQVGLLRPFQGLFLRVTAPVDSAVSGVFEPIAAFLSNAGSINELRDENRALRLENESLQRQVSELQQGADRVQELEKALGIVQEGGAEKRVAARVVNRIATPFDSAVSIDRGTNQGIRAGMVVLSAQGTLIGTVTDALADSSFVRLVTDSRSRVNAQVQETKVDGIVRGTPGRSLVFDMARAEIKTGDRIITSGLGGNYPPGIVIGTVSEVSGSPQDLHLKVKVEPLVRLSTATTVLVLTSFLPQRIELERP